MEGLVKMVKASKSLMGKEMPLEVVPGIRDVVEFPRVFRQPFDGEPWPRAHSGTEGLADMDDRFVIQAARHSAS